MTVTLLCSLNTQSIRLYRQCLSYVDSLLIQTTSFLVTLALQTSRELKTVRGNSFYEVLMTVCGSSGVLRFSHTLFLILFIG